MIKPKEFKHPSDQTDPRERALHYWRWAFDKVIEKERLQQKADLTKAKLNIKNLEESFDSGFTTDSDDEEDDDVYDKEMPKPVKNILSNDGMAKMTRLASRRNLMQQLK